jgi:hypothetical protein
MKPALCALALFAIVHASVAQDILLSDFDASRLTSPSGFYRLLAQ